MAQERIETGKSPMLNISCDGDLLMKGWAESTVLLNGDNFKAVEGEKGLTVNSNGDLKIMVPSDTVINIVEIKGDLAAKYFAGPFNLQKVVGDLALDNLGAVSIDKASGDVKVQNLSGALTLGEAMGDLAVRNVQGIEVTSVYGDFAARNVAGGVKISSVSGDVNLRTVNGNVTVDSGHRDVNLRNIGGQVHVPETKGDIRLRGGLAPGKHNLMAQGDIVVRWPVLEPLNLEASAPEIKNRLTLSDLVQKDGFLSGRLGEGETFLLLEAKGRIVLKEAKRDHKAWQQEADTEFEMDIDFNGLGEQISSEINYQINEWSKLMDEQFGPEFAYKIEQKAQRAAERAEKAAEKAIRKAEKAARKVRWQSNQSTWQAPSRPAQASAKEKKATEAEQLKILQMVESGVISPEEASTLLEAIEN